MRKLWAVALFIGVFTAVTFTTPAICDQPTRQFTLRALAFLGDSAPNGGEFVFDFEPYSINNRGDVGFGADLHVGGDNIGEGIFIRTRKGDLVEVARAGNPTPEGGTTFGTHFSEKIPMNERGDLVFIFDREPVTDVVGINSGVYRFTQHTGIVTPVMLPGDPAPESGEFVGAFTSSGLNNRADIVFAGIVTGDDIDPNTPPGTDGLGVGVFIQDRHGRTSSVVRPGDLAPGGGNFDFADNPSINDHGDVAFGAHVDVDECILGDQFPLFCAESVYVKTREGEIISLAHQSDPAPGGGTYRFASRPVINNQGEVVFLGDLTRAPDIFEILAVFLFSDGEVMPIARPGDRLPGGGEFVTASPNAGTLDINKRGDVVFSASLVKDGMLETGVYLWSGDSFQLVAKTGTQIPGVGSIVQLQPPDVVGKSPFTWAGSAVNDRRQVFFTAAVDDGSGGPLLGVLVLADPPLDADDDGDEHEDEDDDD